VHQGGGGTVQQFEGSVLVLHAEVTNSGYMVDIVSGISAGLACVEPWWQIALVYVWL
jgi:hypothetical protein